MQEEEKKFIPPEAVEDVEKAEEGAYAEKPYRDALLKYEENLTPEQKQALDWIASKEGEEAMKAFEERKGEEDPKIVQLRENAIELLKINDELIKQKLGNKFLDRVQEILNGIGMSKIEDMLKNEQLSLRKKVDLLSNELSYLQNGVSSGIHGTIDVFRVAKEYGIGGERVLDGYLALKIGTQDVASFKKAIRALAQNKRQDEESVVKEFIPYINKARKEGDARHWDMAMERYGYIWMEKNEEYMSLEEEKKE